MKSKIVRVELPDVVVPGQAVSRFHAVATCVVFRFVHDTTRFRNLGFPWNADVCLIAQLQLNVPPMC